ncbi:hypothetical protein G6F35_015081 [Rhizopus arrhizus]|nr:hypothetical protein G6F35_015081 [Rhizopus arrhizus]
MGCRACNKPSKQVRLEGDALCGMTTDTIKQRLMPLNLNQLLEVRKLQHSNVAHLHFKTAESASAFYNNHAGKRLPITSVDCTVLPSQHVDGSVVIYAQRAINFRLASPSLTSPSVTRLSSFPVASSSMAPLSALPAAPSVAPSVSPLVAPSVAPLVAPSVSPLVAPSVAPVQSSA